MENSPIIRVENLKKYFQTSSGSLHAVDDISFSIEKGQTLGVVGESGCGKSTLGRTILRLQEPTSGKVYFNNIDVTACNRTQMKAIRESMQMIFQDPFASINPRMTVSQSIAEPLLIQKKGEYKNKEALNQSVREIMDKVGLAQRLVNTYPHELDGGRRQRIGIGRALALHPQFIVCDEPVSALDVSIQAQILNLMQDIQEEMGLTYLFITHDLSVVKHLSNHIMVMYLGQMVEYCESKQLFRNPVHPYTRALLSSIPIPDPKIKMHSIPLSGELSSPINPKPGCRFAKRCPYATDDCISADIPLSTIEPGHMVACIKSNIFRA